MLIVRVAAGHDSGCCEGCLQSMIIVALPFLKLLAPRVCDTRSPAAEPGAILDLFTFLEAILAAQARHLSRLQQQQRRNRERWCAAVASVTRPCRNRWPAVQLVDVLPCTKPRYAKITAEIFC